MQFEVADRVKIKMKGGKEMECVVLKDDGVHYFVSMQGQIKAISRREMTLRQARKV